MILKKLIRRFKSKPWGMIKRNILKVFYLFVYFSGSLIMFLLYRFRVIRPAGEFISNNIKNILIIRPDGIGDLVLATPVFKALRENFPLAYIAVLVDEETKDLILGNPYINEIFAVKYKGLSGLFRNRPLIHKLIGKRFDLAVVLYSAFWCNLLAVICRIPHRLGYAFHGNGFMLNLLPVEKYENLVKHEVDSDLDLLKLIGVETAKAELRVSISEASDKKIHEFLRNNNVVEEDKIVVIHPGARQECDRWTKNGFARVADYILANLKLKVILLGGPGEEGLIKEIVGLMEKIPIAATGLRISETVSLIKRAGLFIGNSTGTMHIAAALKVPVVAIFGNIHPMDSYHNWYPYGTDNIVVHKDIGCVDCQPSDCIRYRCMEEIQAEEVISSTVKLLNKEANAKERLCAGLAA